MKDSRTIIVINNDRNAPMFSLADLGVVGNVHEIVPNLIEKLRQFQANSTEANKEEIHNEQCGEIVLEPIHLGASAKRKRTEASLNSPTAPNVSPVTPPNRR